MAVNTPNKLNMSVKTGNDNFKKISNFLPPQANKMITTTICIAMDE